jgi:hypothetical protein
MMLGEGLWPRISHDDRLVVAVGLDGKEVVVYPVRAGPVARILLAGFLVAKERVPLPNPLAGESRSRFEGSSPARRSPPSRLTARPPHTRLHA